MHFSCKIPNAILTYLEDQGEDLVALHEVSPIPMELMRDPSYWVNAPDLENFLHVILTMFGKDEELITKIGHDSPSLHAWGVLDSVLRIMPKPQEIFNQPVQFLSHFISPKPPVDNLERDDRHIKFDWPLPAEQYPIVATYLRAALEALPLYIGRPLAQCNWSGINLEIVWSDSQSPISEDNEQLGYQFSPELFQKLIDDLQKTQREREDLQKQVTELEAKITDLSKDISVETTQIEEMGQNLCFIEDKEIDPNSKIHSLNQNLARMHDYMVRAQQLITLLVAQGRLTAEVKQAMKKVDWEHVRVSYPLAVSQSMELLRKIQASKFYQNYELSQSDSSKAPKHTGENHYV